MSNPCFTGRGNQWSCRFRAFVDKLSGDLGFGSSALSSIVVVWEQQPECFVVIQTMIVKALESGGQGPAAQRMGHRQDSTLFCDRSRTCSITPVYASWLPHQLGRTKDIRPG